MALDGVFLSALCKEINECTNQKIEKVYQPQKDEILLCFSRCNLLLSAHSSRPKIMLSKRKRENPQVAPMFCMLLRKHLSSAKLIKAEQQGFERVVKLVFDAKNELMENEIKYIYIEIMGKHSNIILCDKNNIILDSIKHVDFTMSSKRQVLPGLLYENAPSQEKKSIIDFDENDVDFIISQKEKKLSNVLLGLYLGLSPLICREIAFKTAKNTDALCAEIEKEKLVKALLDFKNLILNQKFKPVLYKNKDELIDFTFTELEQYGGYAQAEEKESFSQLIEDFYYISDEQDAKKQKAMHLYKTVQNALSKASRKYENQLSAKEESEKADEYRIKGDILTANLYQIKKGQSSFKGLNYYDGNEIEIELDIKLSPNENAQSYYKKYKKLTTQKKLLDTQMAETLDEIEYLESINSQLELAENAEDLNQIKLELENQKYIKAVSKKKEVKKISLLEFVSSDGFLILCGKNNMQNDYLTYKVAKNYDIWLHTKLIHGSHTVIVTDNKKVSDTALYEAGVICAYYSKAKNSQNVPVDYTFIKNVKKPSGSKPGKAVYVDYKTMYVTPDEEIIKKLMKR